MAAGHFNEDVIHVRNVMLVADGEIERMPVARLTILGKLQVNLLPDKARLDSFG